MLIVFITLHHFIGKNSMLEVLQNVRDTAGKRHIGLAHVPCP